MSANTEHRWLAAIMFTDMVGYSALAQRNEALALELLDEHRRLLRNIFPRHQGAEIKTTGDGFLIEFASALAAVHCAVQIQRALRDRNATEPPDRAVRIRIGIHLGDIVRREGDVFGDGVNIAARIEPLAEPGGICISNAVFEQVRNKTEHPLIHFGAAELKNIQVPLVIYKVGLDEQPRSTPPVKSGRAPSATQPLATRRARRALALVILLVIALNIGLFLRFGLAPPKAEDVTSVSRSPPPSETLKSIAVLPFSNLSANKDADEWLSDGLTEHLITTLSQVRGLRVLPRTSSFAFKGTTDDGSKIAAQLNVSHLLTGGVQKADKRLRISAHLVEAASNSYLWTTNYDAVMDDIFAIQTQVATSVVAALKGTLLSNDQQQLTRQPTFNLEAYELVLKGQYHLNRWTETDWKLALDFLSEATVKDTNYVLAYTGLADCYSIGATWLLPPNVAYAKSRAAVQKALELDPYSDSAHSSLGAVKMWHDWDWPGALASFQRAFELGPKPSFHVGYSFWLCAQGRFDEAVREFERGVQLDPRSLEAHRLLALGLYLKRDYDRALDRARIGLQLDPNHAELHQTLASVYAAKKSYTEALRAAREAKRLTGDEIHDFPIAQYLALTGRKNEATQLLDQTQKALTAQGRYVPGYHPAIVYLGLGDHQAAFQSLDRAIEQRDDFLILLKVEPVFDPIRLHPHFRELLEKLGLAN